MLFEQRMSETSSDRNGWPWQSDNRQKHTPHKEIDWPKITVITPSYNQGKFLEATLRSVILQDYPNLEYLVLDGGSSDNSVEIIKKYEASITHWHSLKDQGQADALATGFEMATGEILCWLNSDDIFLPGALKHVALVFLSHPKTRFLYGNRKVIDESGVVIDHHIWPFFLTKYHWARGQYLAQECTFWRRDLYIQVGGIDRSKFFIMDYDLFYRMWCAAKFRKTTAYLGCIRLHGDSKNSKHQQVRENEFSDALVNYGLQVPGYLMVRGMNRLDAMQVKIDKALQKIKGWAKNTHVS
jgi:glycosyltransferase involved in cell wall biosynthesis